MVWFYNDKRSNFHSSTSDLLETGNTKMLVNRRMFNQISTLKTENLRNLRLISASSPNPNEHRFHITKFHVFIKSCILHASNIFFWWLSSQDFSNIPIVNTAMCFIQDHPSPIATCWFTFTGCVLTLFHVTF